MEHWPIVELFSCSLQCMELEEFYSYLATQDTNPAGLQVFSEISYSDTSCISVWSQLAVPCPPSPPRLLIYSTP